MEIFAGLGLGLGLFSLVGYVFKKTLDVPKNFVDITRFLILEKDVKDIKDIVVRIDERLKHK